MSLQLRDDAGKGALHWTDPTCSAHLKTPGDHYVAVLADGGPKMITFFVDGKLCDGGPNKGWPNVWLLFDPTLANVMTSTDVTVADDTTLDHARLYDRVLYVSDLVGNFNAGKPAPP